MLDREAAAVLPDGDAAPAGLTVELDRDQSRHALRVLRLSVGDHLQLLDGRGAVASATVAGEAGGRVACAVVSVQRVRPTVPRLTVCSAIPKGPRGDAMVNDLAQLGADMLVPMRTARSVVHPGGPKLERYRKQSAEAAKQCGRAWFMEVAALTRFEEALAGHDGAAVRLLADPEGAPTAALTSRLAGATSVVVLIGPEGGFTPAEAASAASAGFVPWRFAEHVLRVETACSAAVAVLRALA